MTGGVEKHLFQKLILIVQFLSCLITSVVETQARIGTSPGVQIVAVTREVLGAIDTSDLHNKTKHNKAHASGCILHDEHEYTCDRHAQRTRMNFSTASLSHLSNVSARGTLGHIELSCANAARRRLIVSPFFP